MRSRDELRRASVHVQYELLMLLGTAERQWPAPRDYVSRCALMESFTIHARAILHFLWPERPHPDDVLARHYFSNEAWSPPPQPASVARLRWEVGKYIAHIAYSRPDPGGEKRWPLSIASDLGECMRTWQRDVEGIDPMLLDNRWRAGPSMDAVDGYAGTGTQSATGGMSYSSVLASSSPGAISMPARATNSSSPATIGGIGAGADIWLDEENACREQRFEVAVGSGIQATGSSAVASTERAFVGSATSGRQTFYGAFIGEQNPDDKDDK